MKCYMCPRGCGADRENGELGACGAGAEMEVALISKHMWEEPCISSKEGSGTIFFYGCPLGCIYCQNYKISRGFRGLEYDDQYNIDSLEKKQDNCVETTLHRKTKIYTPEQLADEMIKLQAKGVNNINLVTPTHYSLKIIEAVRIAKEKGLSIPIVYNCSGYEKVETLKLLKNTVDIYLADFKYMSDELAFKYSKATDYVNIAKAAIHEMVDQKPEVLFDKRGIMKSGVIVRNLLLPGNVNNSKEVCKYVYENYGNHVFLSIMNQYTPLDQVRDINPLNRKVTKREYNRLVDYVIDLGATNVFIQEGEVASESFIPDF